ncbi:hypothetical protein D8674_030217 [Pyrus ussuriensis x Pyrus communis]|uniref:Uncharacterized protein n=1 Tax=Pyrus ussuriensis x Pyrus communis TaxID=2448454 RepID=A0A5N5EVH0_9ROSA|nr:hypothetical protein D8674_030217 [Pyrus ussuriensis x Pyrus communis]
MRGAYLDRCFALLCCLISVGLCFALLWGGVFNSLDLQHNPATTFYKKYFPCASIMTQ